ncbi:MAG: MBL fold metallo-hydrolase [Actinomycetota bacterium]
MLDLELLDAGHGDCMILTYGPDDGSASRHVLIDCGTRGTLDRLNQHLVDRGLAGRRFELFVLTHVDADHIGGAIPFFHEGAAGIEFDDIWFNGWRHLPRNLSARQGEIFSTVLTDQDRPWNRHFDGGPVVASGDRLPYRVLDGGLRLTILSPTPRELRRLRRRWERSLRKAGLTPGAHAEYRRFLGGSRTRSTDIEAMARSKFTKDRSAANGSSIALLAEYGDSSVLLAGDAHAPVLRSTIGSLLTERGLERLPLGALKMAHHGSRRNTDVELLELLDCRRFLVSSDGGHFGHPDREAISRVVVHGGERPELVFNVRSEENAFWDDGERRERWGFDATWPDDGEVLRVGTALAARQRG